MGDDLIYGICGKEWEWSTMHCLNSGNDNSIDCAYLNIRNRAAAAQAESNETAASLTANI